ncbi:cupin domain-containing protein [Streptomyces sp. PTM05]|uniref:Cupin domain-containing protein n=1 Tax=Streptantibioticus parmotrematis TaxID=2873249 RepID=A0ABS7QVY7_9ACTN|nr:cupin domain-containing protein [Streptantibioticus parmotrematis]MBY8887073.1 cupin domain-containing protein [Streptantibioticus parmotrematis]
MTSISPVDLFASFVRLDGDGRAHAEPREFDPSRDGWQLMTFHAETDADVHADRWEAHADADEVVSCLTGGIRLHVRPASEAESQHEEVRVPAGSAVIVPRGRWHRIELDAPSDIMSLVVAHGTRVERLPGV